MAKSKSTVKRKKRDDAEYISYDMCRVCLSTGDLPIFGNDTKPDVSYEVSLFGGIKLLENDEFPKYICSNCFQLLESAISFRKAAKRTETLLKSKKKKGFISNTNIQNKPIKTEDEEDFQQIITIESCSANEVKTNERPNIDFVSEKLDDDFEDELTVKEELLLDNEQTKEIDDDGAEDYDETVMLIVSDKTVQKEENVKKGRFNCKICKVHFETSNDYEEHRSTVEHKRNYINHFMPKKTSRTPVDGKTVNPKDHKCEICNRLFTKLHYPKHMRIQHQIAIETSRSTNKKECTICKTMLHPVALNRHMKRVHGQAKSEKLECPVCKKLFSKDFYRLHLQRHENETKKYICDQCGQKFYFKSTFYTHRLIHTNDLPHKCEYCPYRGRTKGLLKTHVRTHTGDYPYKCTQCDTRCLTKSNLNAHMQRHRGPVDFICDTCNRGFYSKLELERHISVIHLGIRNHVCNICGMAFGYRHGLMSHQLNVHKRAKGVGKAKAVYLRLEEEGLLMPPSKSVPPTKQ